jgi:hypothetical protein
MGLLTSGSCIIMCSTVDSDGIQVLPALLHRIIFLLLLPSPVHTQVCANCCPAKGYTVMRTCNPGIDAGAQHRHATKTCFHILSQMLLAKLRNACRSVD